MTLARRIHAATPTDRDRYLDFLRVGSILLVIVGHWLVRVVTASDGELERGYMLARIPETQWLTLIVQVMPIFFLVGGALNAASWRRARERGEGATSWLKARARRLLRPAVPLLALWIGAAAAVSAAWGERDPLVFGASTALKPLWFLATYLVVTALTPHTLRLHERVGSLALFAIGTVAAIAVDGLRFAVMADGPTLGGQPAVGAVNYPIVFVVIHQLGYTWADDRLPRRRRGQALWALGGAAALVAMIATIYPLTMVPISGLDAPNNLAPPSAALIALGAVQLGLALLARPAIARALERPRVWAAVALPGSRLMTLYLWHQGAMVIAAAAVFPTGLWPAPEEVGASFWATRPLWLSLCALALAPLVLIFQRFECPSAPGASPPRRGRSAASSVAGVILTSGGLVALIATGPADPDGPLRLPIAPITALVIGLILLGVIGRRLAAHPALGRR